MRLIVTLRVLNSCAYDLRYYSKLRGFLYNLQKGSSEFNQHDKEKYKHYCFSNIFPTLDMKEKDKRTLIITKWI